MCETHIECPEGQEPDEEGVCVTAMDYTCAHYTGLFENCEKCAKVLDINHDGYLDERCIKCNDVSTIIRGECVT